MNALWDTVLPGWDTDVAACQIGGAVMQARRRSNFPLRAENSKQAGASDHTQV
jgi:hypothetical protein